MDSQNEERLREAVRSQILKELAPLNENNLVAKHAENAREKIEREVVPVLERLIGIAKTADRDKAEWAHSILEDQKDVYEELSDLESSIRTDDGRKFPGF